MNDQVATRSAAQGICRCSQHDGALAASPMSGHRMAGGQNTQTEGE